MWKISYITAIFKGKGLKCEKENYRPIILPYYQHVKQLGTEDCYYIV